MHYAQGNRCGIQHPFGNIFLSFSLPFGNKSLFNWFLIEFNQKDWQIPRLFQLNLGNSQNFRAQFQHIIYLQDTFSTVFSKQSSLQYIFIHHFQYFLFLLNANDSLLSCLYILFSLKPIE